MLVRNIALQSMIMTEITDPPQIHFYHKNNVEDAFIGTIRERRLVMLIGNFWNTNQ